MCESARLPLCDKQLNTVSKHASSLGRPQGSESPHTEMLENDNSYQQLPVKDTAAQVGHTIDNILVVSL